MPTDQLRATSCHGKLSSLYSTSTSRLKTSRYRVEKYRPTVLDDVVGNEETVARLKVIAKDGNCPHIIISVRSDPSQLHPALSIDTAQGMPGIGKTTSVLCLAHALLGDNYKEGVLELNASDERSVSCRLLASTMPTYVPTEESTSSATESRPSRRKRSPCPPVDTSSSSSTKPIR